MKIRMRNAARIFVSTALLFIFPAAAAVAADIDGDGVVDSIDVDDDNDGILDVVESIGPDGTAVNIYLNDNNQDLIVVTDLDTTPVTTTVGSLGVTMGDLALSPDGTLYGAEFANPAAVILN